MDAQAISAVAGGQRRQALLQRGGYAARRPGLGMDDVRTLQQDRSPEARALVARKFGQQFDELSEEQARYLRGWRGVD